MLINVGEEILPSQEGWNLHFSTEDRHTGSDIQHSNWFTDINAEAK